MWADHEARDPGSLKGRPGERAEFFYFYDEVASLVDVTGRDLHDDLIAVVGAAACERWREHGERDPALAWVTDAAAE